MMKVHSQRSQSPLSSLTIMSAFAAFFLQVHNVHALHITRALAGADGVWTAYQDYHEPLLVTEDGITIDLNGHSVLSSEWYAINVNWADNVSVISSSGRSWVQGYTSQGIYAIGSSHLTVRNVYGVGEEFGIFMESCEDATLDDVIGWGYDYDGVWLQNCAGSSLYEVQAHYCGRHGIVVAGGYEVDLFGCETDYNSDGYGTVLLDSPDFLMMGGAAIRNIHGFLFSDSDGEVVSCTARENTVYGFVDSGYQSYILNSNRNNSSSLNGTADWQWDWH